MSMVPALFVPALGFYIDPRAIVTLVILFAVGLALFLAGFFKYRKFRLLEDTPLEPVRGLAMGLVHVRGKATGPGFLTSPLTHTPCYWYEAVVERWEAMGTSSHGWNPLRKDEQARHFYLEDGSGRVLVNPAGAELDLPQNLLMEIGPEVTEKPYLDPSLGIPLPTAAELHTYLGHHPRPASPAPGSTAGPPSPAAGGFTGDTWRYRFTEACLIAERQYNILGTCIENPKPKDERDRNLLAEGESGATFLITSKNEQMAEKWLRRTAFLAVVIGAALIIVAVALALSEAGLF